MSKAKEIERVALYFKERSCSFIYVAEGGETLSIDASIRGYCELGPTAIAQLVEAWAYFGVRQVGPAAFPLLSDGRILWSWAHRLGSSMRRFDCTCRDLLDSSFHSAVDRARYKGALAREYERAIGHEFYNPRERVQGLLLPDGHPVKEVLDRICRDPIDFLDGGALSRAGFFSADERVPQIGDEFMVFSHRELSGYLLKCFRPVGEWSTRSRYRLKSYINRVENSRAMRGYIEKRGFGRVAVPQKWLYHLGGPFATPEAPFGHYMVVAERLVLLPLAQSRRYYQTISAEALHQLVDLWYDHPWFEASLDNMPITETGEIAIVDTEHSESRSPLSLSEALLRLLTSDGKRLATQIIEEKITEKERAFVAETPPAEEIDIDRAERLALALNDCFGSEGQCCAKGYTRVGFMRGEEYILRHPNLPGYRVVVTVGSFRKSERVAFKRFQEGPLRLREYIEESGVSCLEKPECRLLTLSTGRTLALERAPYPANAEENLKRYQEIDRERLEELVRAIFDLQIWGVGPRWMPFSTGGKLMWMEGQRLNSSVHLYEREFVQALAPELRPYARELRFEQLWRRCEREAAQGGAIDDPRPGLAHLLLPDDHPIRSALEQIFQDPRDFIDRTAMEEYGCISAEQPPASPLERFVVCSHPLLPGHLIKTYSLYCDQNHYSEHLPNFVLRIENARYLAEAVAWAGLDQVVIPQKWLYWLPPQFADPLTPYGKAVLIAERLDLRPAEETEAIYLSLHGERMVQLLKLILCTRSIDVWLANMPMTRDGRIAFVDTERVRPL